MPRNEDFTYVPVPFHKNSPVLARLKEEASRAQERDVPYIGPYIADLLEDRDVNVYGGEQAGKWYVSHDRLSAVIEAAVQKALHATLPSLLAFATPVAQPQQPVAVIEETSEEQMEAEAVAMAASLTGWGDDDDDEESA